MYSHCSLARVLAIKACKPLGAFTKIIRLYDFDSVTCRSRILLAEDENDGKKKEMEMTRKMTISELLVLFCGLGVNEKK